MVRIGALCVLVLTGTFSGSSPRPPKLTKLPAKPGNVIRHGGRLTRPGHRPNIVFVLTDDLSDNLIPYMPEVQALENEGVTFDNSERASADLAAVTTSGPSSLSGLRASSTARGDKTSSSDMAAL